MNKYYSVIIFISIASMWIMQVAVSKSGTLAKSRKQLFHMLFSSIALATLCEWLGIYLQGTGPETRIVHMVVKAVEFSVAPCIGVMIGWMLDMKRRKIAAILLGVNVILECLSGIFGFIYRVDANSYYTHGDFYWIYIVAYMATIGYTFYCIAVNAKRYQYTGTGYFVMVILLMIAGIAVQLTDSSLKVDYITLTLVSIMLYVFTLEMLQQTDQLTELVNRRGYENYISHVEEPCAVLFLDMNKFKQVNDTYGHAVGDICISLTGKAIKETYMRYGKCFRYGGDEFCVILTKRMDEIETLNTEFFEKMESLRKDEKRLPHVSIGYAYFNPESGNMRTTIEEADQMMYRYKEQNR